MMKGKPLAQNIWHDWVINYISKAIKWQWNTVNETISGIGEKSTKQDYYKPLLVNNVHKWRKTKK